MNTHLTADHITGYTHQTLTDAEREAMNRHLTECNECRAHLESYTALQHRIRYSLRAELQTVQPAAQMQFDRTFTYPTQRTAWQRATHIFNYAVALAGLGLIFSSIFNHIPYFLNLSPSQPTATFPALACFLFSIPVAVQYHESRRFKPRKVVTGMLAFLLWLGTIAVGLYQLVIIREMLMRVCTYFQSAYWTAVVIGQWSVYILSLVWIMFTIGTGEYHYRHYGRRHSWAMFGWTLGVEAVILLLALVI